MAFTPIHSTHDTTKKVDEEFVNAEANLQDQQLTVFVSTPNLQDLKDGQLVRVSSGTFSKLMYRDNQEIYAIAGSCVTVRR